MTTSLHPTKNLSSPGERLRYIRAMLRVSRSYLQEKYDIPEVTLKAWENETVNITPAAIKRCIEAYQQEGLVISEDWIVEGIGLDPTSQLAVGRYFSMPTQKDLPIEDDEIAMIRDANEFKEKYSNAVVMIVSNDEMRPFFKPGDYVGGIMRFGKDIPYGINKNCIVHLKNEAQYFRRLIKNPKGEYHLVCLNPDVNTQEPVLYNVDIAGVAPVIWHRWKDE